MSLIRRLKQIKHAGHIKFMLTHQSQFIVNLTVMSKHFGLADLPLRLRDV